ncbi:MAG: NAD(P)/FAD-dependent oxidoreductase [bacterium]|jgi:thioredoxin reductase (NADPH)|nr:NAD(P)/FAD-dependent oxidoreductase [Gemmatimonadota bacterium]HIL89267.1 NAD(P)/FAD-dependent oxidoreductase [Gemmatimonadota bacterium]
MADEIRDITVIGGGPTGLFAAFYAGMRNMSCRIIDSLPELGGQLTALYPEKYIFDVGGFPKVLAKDLAVSLIDQAMQFKPDIVLDEQVEDVQWVKGHFALHCGGGVHLTKIIVIAGGKGAFEPMPLRCPGYEEMMHRGIEYSAKDPEAFRGKQVVVVGGGDSALDFVLMLKDVVASMTLVHRRDGWRAHEVTVQRMQEAVALGEVKLHTFHEVREILGESRVEKLTIYENRTAEELSLGCDILLSCLGFKPNLGPVKKWGVEVTKNRITVDQLMRTNIEGIYAAGDIVSYEGKLDLIASGFSEAAIAVNHAVHYVDPSARMNPGHSTNMKVFNK